MDSLIMQCRQLLAFVCVFLGGEVAIWCLVTILAFDLEGLWDFVGCRMICRDNHTDLLFNKIYCIAIICSCCARCVSIALSVPEVRAKCCCCCFKGELRVMLCVD